MKGKDQSELFLVRKRMFLPLYFPLMCRIRDVRRANWGARSAENKEDKLLGEYSEPNERPLSNPTYLYCFLFWYRENPGRGTEQRRRGCIRINQLINSTCIFVMYAMLCYVYILAAFGGSGGLGPRKGMGRFFSFDFSKVGQIGVIYVYLAHIEINRLNHYLLIVNKYVQIYCLD